MANNSKIKFFQDNAQVFYSIALMIVIPGAVILNTYLFSQSLRTVIDQSLQERAVAIGEAFNAGVIDKLNSPEQMQVFVDTWKLTNSNTQNLDIFYRENNNYRIVASFDKNRVASLDENNENLTLYELARINKNSIARKIVDSGSRYWWVVVPLKDSLGQQQALLSMRLSADVIDTVLASALSRSFWILIISVLVIVLLLFANSRLFEYSLLYNKIKEVDAMKDEFISMASHELRTPVTVIRGYLSMILEDPAKSGISNEAKEYLSIANVSTERLNSLIEDLLDVSRIEQGRLKMSIGIVDVWPIIEDTLKELKIQADAKSLALVSKLDPGTKTFVNADKDRFKQVLINIIGNSIKYTPSGSVEVRGINNRDNKLVITIKDTGIGMTAKEREHLFEKFYRVKNKKTEEIVGTGLGLWITRQIVELMGGSIMVDSMEGVGTQVTMEFPLSEADKNQA
ncbi:MAG: HAMP domain-containing sensor histidine kinase [Candidatus Pacebacteria bacterium]|nr:HAMP domain-containing sensor histidine kinase [Candidatus Paceibacterota bacterium]